jgi:dCMP deaminase
MREVQSWGDYFLEMAHMVASRSKDPSTQVGCVLVVDNEVIATGYNGMPAGAEETAGVWERPLKYDLVLHSEVNAVGRAARNGVSTRGAIAYLTHFPCLGCAKVLAGAGISRVVAQRLMATGWDEEHQKAARLFEYAGITYQIIE